MSRRKGNGGRARGSLSVPVGSVTPHDHARLFAEDWSELDARQLDAALVRLPRLGQRILRVAESDLLGRGCDLRSPAHAARMLGPLRVRHVVLWDRCLEHLSPGGTGEAAQCCVVVAAAAFLLAQARGLARYEVPTLGLGGCLGVRLLLPDDHQACRFLSWQEGLPSAARFAAAQRVLGHTPETAAQAFAQVVGVPDDLRHLLAGALPCHADLVQQANELARRPGSAHWQLALRRQSAELGEILACPVDLDRIGAGPSEEDLAAWRPEELRARRLLS